MVRTVATLLPQKVELQNGTSFTFEFVPPQFQEKVIDGEVEK